LVVLEKDATLVDANPKKLAALVNVVSVFKTLEPLVAEAAAAKGANFTVDLELISDAAPDVALIEADLATLGIVFS
jgi:hypothetical protein